jgi:predicted nucleic acid-binding protein
MTYVLDAAVVVKWFCPEPLSDQACCWLALDAERIAPDLLLVECANVFRKKIKHGSIDADNALRALSALAEGPLRMVASVDFAAGALLLAGQMDHPVYDCIYLECARQSGGILVTADAAFLKRAQACGFAEKMLWVGDGPNPQPTPPH